MKSDEKRPTVKLEASIREFEKSFEKASAVHRETVAQSRKTFAAMVRDWGGKKGGRLQ